MRSVDRSDMAAMAVVLGIVLVVALLMVGQGDDRVVVGEEVCDRVFGVGNGVVNVTVENQTVVVRCERKRDRMAGVFQ